MERARKIGRTAAIRKKCLNCSGFSKTEVRLCPCEDCALWPYRMGYERKIDSKPQNVRKKPQN